MQRFEDIKELTEYMFRRVHSDEMVTVVADKELAVSVMKELLDDYNAILDFAEVNEYEYDKEYFVSLSEDSDDDCYHVAIEQAYNYDKNMYFGTGGHVLFHEDVNSKAYIQIKNHGDTESGCDWFVIGEDEEADCNDCCHSDNASCSCSKDTECSDNENLHGFTITKSDGDSYIDFSIHTTDKMSKDDIRSFLKEIGF